MSSNRESAILIVTLLATLGVVGGGLWFIKEYLRFGSPTTSISPNKALSGSPSPDNCQIANAPQGLFSYGGSTTWAVIRQQTEPAIAQLCPHFRLRYTEPIGRAPGSQTGIDMLIDDQLAFSQSSQSLTPADRQKAQARGFSLKEIPVAIDAIAIGVHPQQKVSNLTVAQLREIYTGKLTNWNQLGGANLKITPYSRPQDTGGTVKFFAENVLQNRKFSPKVKDVRSTTLAVRQIAADPGAIYYASAPEIISQCGIKLLSIFNNNNQLIPPYQEPLVTISDCPQKRNRVNAKAFEDGSYPITRRLFAILKLNGRIDQQAGEAYAQWLLSSSGQEKIEQAGLVPIYK